MSIPSYCMCTLIILAPCPLVAISFDSFIKPFKKISSNVESNWNTATRDIKNAANTVSNAITDRFRDTKLTRSVDYSVRIAALYTARKTAELALDAAKKITEGSLNSSIDTMQLGITAGDVFLGKIVAQAGPELLEKTAQTGEGFLEGVKVSGVATVSGGAWVAQNLLGQFDVNDITYKGSLYELERGILGGVNVQGRILGTPFSAKIDLDPQAVAHSFAQVTTDLGNKIKRTIYDPLFEKSKTTTRTLETTRIQAETALQSPPPPAIIQAGNTLRTMNAALAEYTALQTRLQAELDDAVKQLEKAVEEIASKTTQELKSLITQQPTAAGSPAAAPTTNLLARQELARRMLR